MNFVKILIVIPLIVWVLSSCSISQQVGTFQVEILKPGIFNIPEDVKSIALFNRDVLKSDTLKVSYIKDGHFSIDTTIHYRTLSNYCLDSLSVYLKNQGYFSKVVNFRDSLNAIFQDPISLLENQKLFKISETDAIVFLDYFHFNTSMVYDYGNRFYTNAMAKWSVAFKNDTSTYLYNQLDTMIFEDREFFEPKFKPVNIRFIEASENLGVLFGTKLIPFPLTVDRMYYKSLNPEMLTAQKLAFNNDWLNAAEIWNRITKSKNRRQAAKAMFNMALVCEMEGKPELAIDWLVKSYSGLKHDDKDHKLNCQRYINVLALRKLEIAKLGKQIR